MERRIPTLNEFVNESKESGFIDFFADLITSKSVMAVEKKKMLEKLWDEYKNLIKMDKNEFVNFSYDFASMSDKPKSKKEAIIISTNLFNAIKK